MCETLLGCGITEGYKVDFEILGFKFGEFLMLSAIILNFVRIFLLLDFSKHLKLEAKKLFPDEPYQNLNFFGSFRNWPFIRREVPAKNQGVHEMHVKFRSYSNYSASFILLLLVSGFSMD